MEKATVAKWEELERLRGSDGRPVEANVRAAAALLGPGYRGRRATLSKEERQAAAKEVQKAWEEGGFGAVPAYMIDAAQGRDTDWRERKSKLFEAGDYADKALSAGQAEVNRLAANFDYPVPVLIEHVENPLRLGYLTQVEAAGPELFGILALTPEADDLIESSGAKSLSLSVSRDLERIYEVSIVGNPRIKSARLFCDDFRAEPGGGEWKKEAARLKAQLEKEQLQTAVERMVRSGELPPGSAENAKALLSAARQHGFEKEAVAFFESLPNSVIFGEIVPGSKAPPAETSPEEAAFYARHFSDLPIEEIAKRRD